MRALVTGASSFTGCWFALALASQGVTVTAIQRRPRHVYPPAERARLALLADRVTLLEAASLASEPVLAAIARSQPDLLCLHGAAVGDHRDPRYDVLEAVARTTEGLDHLLDAFSAAGGRAVLVTGSVFEVGEGASTEPLRAVNLYGLAKSLIWQIVRFAAERRGLILGKFVIAHPVGPFDKTMGLVPDLLAAWRRGEPALVRRPELVRDFLPIDALAAAYAAAALKLLGHGSVHLVPSLWPERTATFARRMARALRSRMGLDCAVAECEPSEPSEEPAIRIGLHDLRTLVPAWDPEAFWDLFARALDRPLTAAELSAHLARLRFDTTEALRVAA